jgi:hypothetical protein
MKNLRRFLAILSIMAAFVLSAGMCSEESPEELAEAAVTYHAEVDYVWDVLMPANSIGTYNEEHTMMTLIAKMRYVLTFNSTGGSARIEKVYEPYKMNGLTNAARDGLTDEEEAAWMAKTDFDVSRVLYCSLQFSGGPDGKFTGTNPDTGKAIKGHITKEKGIWYAVFTEDIQQTYVIKGNPWP